MPARSWLSWSKRLKLSICLGAGEEALPEPARASLPFRKWWVWLGGHAKKFLERLTICALVSLTWQGHAPSPQILPSFRSPAVPPAGLFVFGARCSRNSQLWNAFPGPCEVDRSRRARPRPPVQGKDRAILGHRGGPCFLSHGKAADPRAFHLPAARLF